MKTVTVCLNDWAQAYLDVAKARFVPTSYREKRSMFKRFFTEILPTLPVANLKQGDVQNYIVNQKEVRSGYAANKDPKNLVAAWTWGMKYMKSPLPGPNPCLVERMPEVRHPRYVPSEEDFWKVVDAAEGQDKVMLLAFLFLLPAWTGFFAFFLVLLGGTLNHFQDFWPQGKDLGQCGGYLFFLFFNDPSLFLGNCQRGFANRHCFCHGTGHNFYRWLCLDGYGWDFLHSFSDWLGRSFSCLDNFYFGFEKEKPAKAARGK